MSTTVHAATTTEAMTFIIIRGIVSLAIIGVAFYCIAQGIHFFSLPRPEAEQIRVHLLGLEITASGLGAVIFGTGLALCFVGWRAAPKWITATSTMETASAGASPPQPPAPQPPAPTAAPSTPSLSPPQPPAPEPPASTIVPSAPSSGVTRSSVGVTVCEPPGGRSGGLGNF